ncbi:septum formation inhibitor Maf [Helicobacter sp. 11S02596-1]|uniref:septum formation inhibitor Maf n=1 Tax=Helicobacter sp. 11S02596-1 TaxID=1476194 RepID=UPI000BA66F0F|nr:septum formation inhibitor Maf [Helicobacter sp. 11S02596-1]PAF44704.1 hypothetical protein BJI48_01555 [Helicobacter sp. 11S02596-1]
MIILASASLARAKLLRDFGVAFIQKPLDFDEDSIQTKNPKKFVYEATAGKLKAALETFGDKSPVLVADSVISVQGELQRKAKNTNEAVAFLNKQNAQTIEILTCMMYHAPKIDFIDISVTAYELYAFEPEDLRDYLDSKDWMGKAGCVMVEGFHKRYIKSQVGLTSTAMGLSVEKILPFLEII